jgi:hypothetical protein
MSSGFCVVFYGYKIAKTYCNIFSPFYPKSSFKKLLLYFMQNTPPDNYKLPQTNSPIYLINSLIYRDFSVFYRKKIVKSNKKTIFQSGII